MLRFQSLSSREMNVPRDLVGQGASQLRPPQDDQSGMVPSPPLSQEPSCVPPTRGARPEKMTSRCAEQHCGWCSRRTPDPQRQPSLPPPPPRPRRGTLSPEHRSDKSPDRAPRTPCQRLSLALVSIWDSPVGEEIHEGICKGDNGARRSLCPPLSANKSPDLVLASPRQLQTQALLASGSLLSSSRHPTWLHCGGQSHSSPPHTHSYLVQLGGSRLWAGGSLGSSWSNLKGRKKPLRLCRELPPA